MPEVLLSTGRTFRLDGPRTEDVDLDAIAEGLAKLPRFSGQTPNVHYSVAQHCCLVAALVEHLAPIEVSPHDAQRLVAAGLLHDAHEALLGGDLPTPVRAALAGIAGVDAYAALADRIDAAVFAACGLDARLRCHNAIRQADELAAAIEARDLMPDGTERRFRGIPDDLPPHLRRPIRPWPWPYAAERWIEELRRIATLADLRGPALAGIFH